MRNHVLLIGMLTIGGCATDESGEGSTAAATSGRQCLVHMEPGDAPGDPAKVGAMSCYDTIAEVMQVATNGRLVLPAATKGSEITEGMLRSVNDDAEATAASGIVIGTDYELPNYSGASLTWTALFGCYDRFTGATFNWAANMPAGWDNVVSSVTVSGRCSHSSVYDLTNRGGLSQGLSGCRAPSLTYMDNRTSSQDWLFGSACP